MGTTAGERTERVPRKDSVHANALDQTSVAAVSGKARSLKRIWTWWKNTMQMQNLNRLEPRLLRKQETDRIKEGKRPATKTNLRCNLGYGNTMNPNNLFFFGFSG
jgi:hypothetical protein